MIRGHGGNIYELASALGCSVDEIIDMSSNVNPSGPPPGLRAHLKEHMDQIRALPEVDAQHAVERFADHFGIPPDQVLAGNGTDGSATTRRAGTRCSAATRPTDRAGG